jgi:hypothetical protein
MLYIWLCATHLVIIPLAVNVYITVATLPLPVHSNIEANKLVTNLRIVHCSLSLFPFASAQLVQIRRASNWKIVSFLVAVHN